MKAVYVLGGAIVAGAAILAIATLRRPAPAPQAPPAQPPTLEGAASRAIDVLLNYLAQSMTAPTRDTGASDATASSAPDPSMGLSGSDLRGMLSV